MVAYVLGRPIPCSSSALMRVEYVYRLGGGVETSYCFRLLKVRGRP